VRRETESVLHSGRESKFNVFLNIKKEGHGFIWRYFVSTSPSMR